MNKKFRSSKCHNSVSSKAKKFGKFECWPASKISLRSHSEQPSSTAEKQEHSVDSREKRDMNDSEKLKAK